MLIHYLEMLKARRELKWKPQINIHRLIDEMITEEMNILSNDQ